MPKVLNQVYIMTAKFVTFFEHAETGEKRQSVISSSTRGPISVIFAIHISFGSGYIHDCRAHNSHLAIYTTALCLRLAFT